MNQPYVKDVKNRIRRHVWSLLEERGVARFPKPIYGRIPNFVGAEDAASKLFRTELWKRASAIKVNPDSPQRVIRYKALLEGKTVVTASPRLLRGFIVLQPRSIPPHLYSYASTIPGFFRLGKIVGLEDIPRVDLVVTGSVAVDREGRRLGKGGGYCELEYAILREIGVVDEETPIVTTVHDLQVVEQVPLEPHDLTVDYIFTPTRGIEVKPRGFKPKGIIWDILGEKRELKVIKDLVQLRKLVDGL